MIQGAASAVKEVVLSYCNLWLKFITTVICGGCKLCANKSKVPILNPRHNSQNLPWYVTIYIYIYIYIYYFMTFIYFDVEYRLCIMNNTPAILGVQSWRESTARGTQTKTVEYYCSETLNMSTYAQAWCFTQWMEVSHFLLHTKCSLTAEYNTKWTELTA
jgi:hypothetical protein